ncbi:MAG: hypothetical protein H6747_15055 [Deltaproteobacteria bacterium]|nr:hypothetical protein [Deltaproteobacteria bacterium]
MPASACGAPSCFDSVIAWVQAEQARPGSESVQRAARWFVLPWIVASACAAPPPADEGSGAADVAVDAAADAVATTGDAVGADAVAGSDVARAPNDADLADAVPGCSADADCEGRDDGDLCNGRWRCAAQQCVFDPATRVQCDLSADGPCVETRCAPATGACAQQPRTGFVPCDDGDPCTTSDHCQAGQCAGKSGLCECSKDADCAAQDDDDLCTPALYCEKGGFPYTCEKDFATLVVCDKSGDTACAKNVCQPTLGLCVLTPKDGVPCDDGDACTAGETCKDGGCAAGKGICECKVDFDCAGKEDGNLCNGTLACVGHTCTIDESTIVSCDQKDASPCLAVACDPKSGACQKFPAIDGVPCSDGDPCTGGDACKSASCLAGAASCECKQDADCQAKEDGNACNGTLLCQNNACVLNAATVVTCDKGADTACAKAQCAATTGSCGLVAVQDGSPCDDGDACTSGESCAAGSCSGGKPVCGGPPTGSEVYQAVFAANNCGGCHGSFNGANNTLANLQTGSYCGAKFVVPGDASKSAIVWKLVAGVGLPGGCGQKMPPSSSGISASAAAKLQAWIDAGAKP